MDRIFVVGLTDPKGMRLNVFRSAQDAYETLASRNIKTINGRFCREIYINREGMSCMNECRMHYIPGVICGFTDEDGRMADYFAPGEKRKDDD